jgi:type II secretory pathway component PulF
MPIYYCKTINKEGKINEFIREAVSEEILVRELTKEDVSPITVRETRRGGKSAYKRKKYSRKSILEFTSIMNLLLYSGLTLKDALEIAQTIYLKGEVNEIVVSLLEEIKKGHSFYKAIETYSASFPPFFTGFIRIAEKLGSLEGSFKRINEYMLKEKQLRDKLAGSLIYSLLLFGIALVCVCALVFFIIPVFVEKYAEMGVALPESISSVVSNVKIIFSVLIGTAVSFLVFLPVYKWIKKKYKKIAVAVDGFGFKIPLFGRLSFLKENFNFLYAMETLTKSGYTIEEALSESARVLKNQAFISGISKSREKIMKGEDLSKALLSHAIFSERLGKWVAVGERTGTIDRVFGQLRVYFEAELEKFTTNLMNLIHPVVIIVAGLLILWLLLTVIVPIITSYGELI